jgi:hypothetical protein
MKIEDREKSGGDKEFRIRESEVSSQKSGAEDATGLRPETTGRPAPQGLGDRDRAEAKPGIGQGWSRLVKVNQAMNFFRGEHLPAVRVAPAAAGRTVGSGRKTGSTFLPGFRLVFQTQSRPVSKVTLTSNHTQMEVAYCRQPRETLPSLVAMENLTREEVRHKDVVSGPALTSGAPSVPGEGPGQPNSVAARTI